MKAGQHIRRNKHIAQVGNAFTLIELLVVMAIISLLVAMLLPVLVEARRAAQAAACLSNQKQIYIGTALFLDDHQQMLPPATSKYAPSVNINDVNWGPKSIGVPNTPFGWQYEFYGKYLNVPISNKRLTNFNNILYCPGGFRMKRRTQNCSWYYSTGVTEVDYHLAGLSPTDSNDNIMSRVGYTIYRAGRYWWRHTDSLGPVVFSYDQGTRDTKRQPHARDENNSLTVFGMNVIEVDGRGKWKKPGEFLFYNWHGSHPADFWAHPKGYRIPWHPIYDTINKRWGMRLASDPAYGYHQDYSVDYGLVNVYVTD